MGILSSVSTDIEDLVLNGFDDSYIEKSVGLDRIIIQPFINYFRDKHNIHLNSIKKTNKVVFDDSLCL